MNKQLIGIFRIGVYLVIVFFYAREFDNFNFKFWISDLIYGSHSEEFRGKILIDLIMLVYYGIISFYILQTFLYISIGSALQDKRTGLFRFIGMFFSAVWEISQNPHLWFTSSGSRTKSNIERVLEYRDAKMSNMTNEQAVKFMSGTAHVDFMMTRPDLKQHSRALNYMDSKMSSMDNETALKYIKGQSK